MTDARLRLKVNLMYEERNDDVSTAHVEDYIEDAITKAIEDVRISAGPGAGAVFVLLERDVALSSKLSGWSPERLAESVVSWLESLHYLNDVTIENWIVRPHDGDEA